MASQTMSKYGYGPFKALFIRGPVISGADADVKVLAKFDGRIVLARQRNMLACSFHPEMGDDLRIHRYFADMVEQNS